MGSNVLKMRQDRFKVWRDAKEILEGAKKENRDLTQEEETRFDTMMADVDARQEKIDAIEKAEERSSKMDAMAAEFEEVEGEAPKMGADRGSVSDVEKRTKAFRKVLASTESSEFSGAMTELRALQMDSDPAGGYTVVPQQFVAKLIEGMKNATLVRPLATVYSVPRAQSLGVPTLANRPADPTWTSELLIGSADSTMDFGKRELYPHPLAQYIKLSKKLVRASALDIESIVRDQLAYKAAVVEENSFLNGDGANEPLGVFIASANGIDTGRDASTGNTDTSIMGDGLIEAKYTLHPGYWNRARWIFHRDAIKQIRKLKDGDGQYMWKPGISNDRGDTILDIPALMSEYAPNTFTTGLYVGILGDFSNYWIADALDMQIQVLVELFAATNQNGYVLRKETDGMPVLEEAFVRVTLA